MFKTIPDWCPLPKDAELQSLQSKLKVQEKKREALEQTNAALRAEVFDIAYEAHMMGRVYNRMGEPETPAQVVNAIKNMISIKLKALSGEEGG